MTPEDLEKMKALVATQSGQPLPPKVDIPQIAPEAQADPYNKAAQDYNTRADALEKQSMQPRPQPQGAKENLVASLRNAMENMGRWGAPGGYYGQEELRQQEADKQNATRMGLAQQLRSLAEKQQGLGINAENVARQENYNQGQLEETRQLRQRQDAQEQELNRHNAAMENIEQNKPVSMAPGTKLATPQGKVLAENAPKQKDLRHITLDNNGKPEIWSIDANSQPIAKIGDAPAGSSATSSLALSQSTDGSGNPVLTIVDKKNATARPVVNQSTNTPVLTSDVGKNNVKNDAKESADYDTAVKSLTNMAGQMDSARKNPRGAYANDQAMADAFFNIIKPGSGARMNETQINRFITPGPLRDKMIAWAQKLDNGAPLDDAARQDLYNSAKIVVDSKKPKPRSVAPAASSNGGWSVKVVQ